MATEIHKTAIVDKDATIGDNVYIGPYVVIESEVEIGDGCRIEPFAQIKRFTKMGRNNHIHSYACIGGPPQDLKFKGEESYLIIGNDNCIREYVTLNRGTKHGGGVTKIGSRCLIMAYAHVAHDCILEDEVIMANAASLAGHVIIEKGAVLGGLSAIHQFVRIGKYAYIGGLTGVAQDVPPFTLIAGERGSMHGLNLVGLRRRGFSKEDISKLKRAYKILWREGLKKDEAIEKIQVEFGNHDMIMELVNFVKNSKRGIVPPKKIK
ncbi:acyl-ACP--UDP-N-acetylglucosamine O-acyltransferase [Desulfothermus naphthae]